MEAPASAWDEYWMNLALAQARMAAAQGEVPVGAMVVAASAHDERGIELARAANQPIAANDPTAHAEISALRLAATAQKNYRLVDATLYVTLEPCMMCAGALVHARVQRLVFGALEPKAGAVVSHPLLTETWLNHQPAVTHGVLAEACGEIMTTFFAERRRINNPSNA
ncbi:MAG: tRNA adenosine(34) deaminase TadA [Chromatocurvus sp.]